MKVFSWVLGMLLPAVMVAQEIEEIPGWASQEQNGHYIFTPSMSFIYEVMPLDPNGGSDLEAWLNAAATKNIQTSRYAVKERKTTTVQSFKMLSASITDKYNKAWVMHMVAYQKPDGAVRSAKILMPPPGDANSYMNTAIKHFLDLSKKEGIVLKANNNNTTTKTTTTSKPTTPLTAPGQGLKPGQIKGVVIHNETSVGVGGMIIMEYKPYLMLTDGTVYEYPVVSPYDLDVPKSKIQEPNKWGTWKQEGKTMLVAMPDSKAGMKTSRWESQWFWTQMPKPGERMTGGFKTISGGGNTAMGGNTMIVIASNVNFNSKGQFIMKKTSGGSNTDFDVSTTTYANSNSAGTYSLNGYSIEMKYNNGEVVRKLFYFYPDSRKHFGIGRSVYIPEK